MIPTLFSYLPRNTAIALCKVAMANASGGNPEGDGADEEQTEQPKRPSIGKTLLAHGAGISLGTAAGYLAGKGADYLWQKTHNGAKIPLHYLALASPVIGAGMGLAYTLAKAHEAEELQRAIKNPNDQPGGSHTREQPKAFSP